MTKPAAILDIDGSLVDSNYFHAIAWYRAFRAHGHTLPMWRIHRALGMGGDQMIAALLSGEVEEREGDAAVMIGDSVYDCEAAANAGLETIAVLTGGFSDSELLKSGARIVFASIVELRERLSWTPLG